MSRQAAAGAALGRPVARPGPHLPPPPAVSAPKPPPVQSRPGGPASVAAPAASAPKASLPVSLGAVPPPPHPGGRPPVPFEAPSFDVDNKYLFARHLVKATGMFFFSPFFFSFPLNFCVF